MFNKKKLVIWRGANAAKIESQELLGLSYLKGGPMLNKLEFNKFLALLFEAGGPMLKKLESKKFLYSVV